MLAYGLLLLGIILLYALIKGNGKAVFQSVLGQAQAGASGPTASVQGTGSGGARTG